MCYKLGRVTVPPAVVLAGAGMGLEAIRNGDGKDGEDKEPVMKTWDKIRALRRKETGKGQKQKWTKMQEIMRGGWKDESSSSSSVSTSNPTTSTSPSLSASVGLPPRWWELAMAPYEEERRRRTKVVEAVVGKGAGVGMDAL
jgi:hypothetical protein